MERTHFYKSMTSYADHRVWQDVYHVPSLAGTLYVKFTADVVTGFYWCPSRRQTMTNPVCPTTGEPMSRGVKPMTLTYKGVSLIIDMPGWYCETSEESVHNGDDMKVSDRALNRLKAREEGLPLPEDIKQIRSKLGLTQEAAGALIGGGPRAFQKYEAGDLLPSRAIASVLTLLDNDPSGITVLQSCQSITRPRGTTSDLAERP